MQSTDEKHNLKTRNVKIRYEFPYFWKIRLIFFLVDLVKSLKPTRISIKIGFPECLILQCDFWDACMREKEALKNAYKTCVFLMISNLDVSFMKIRCCKNSMIFMIFVYTRQLAGRSMDLWKYVMFSDDFVNVDYVVLRDCSKTSINTGIFELCGG